DAAIRASPVRFLLSVTDARSGLNELLDVRARPEPIPLLLKASSALPVLYNRRIALDGREYVDGGVSDSLPIAGAIANGCTDVLVLASSRCDVPMTRPGFWEQRCFQLMVGRRYPALMRAFASMHETVNRSRRLATGHETVEGVNVALIAPCEDDSTVGTTAIERARLVRGAHQMATRTLELFAGERAILEELFTTYRERSPVPRAWCRPRNPRPSSCSRTRHCSWRPTSPRPAAAGRWAPRCVRRRAADAGVGEFSVAAVADLSARRAARPTAHADPRTTAALVRGPAAQAGADPSTGAALSRLPHRSV